MIWIALLLLPSFAFVMTLLNVATWRRGSPSFKPNTSVSVLIPARNEERTLGAALKSVLNSANNDLIREVLIYDDQSTDKTQQVASTWASRDPRVRLVPGLPLPSGWVGKPHACAQLARAANYETLLFMDADVRLKRTGLTRLLSLSANEHGDVVSAVPQQQAQTLAERLVIPLLVLTYTSWLFLRAVEWGRDPRTVAANGQLLLVTRDAYDTIGGFEAVRAEVVDDVAFCRRAKTLSQKVIFADGTLMADCRMYEGHSELINGFSKNLHEGVGGSWRLLATMFLYVAAFLLPYLALVASMVVPTWRSSLLPPALIGVGINIALRATLAARFRQPWDGLALHPLSIAALLGIALNSWRWHRRDAIYWAGRTYQTRTARTLDRERSKELPLCGGTS